MLLDFEWLNFAKWSSVTNAAAPCVLMSREHKQTNALIVSTRCWKWNDLFTSFICRRLFQLFHCFHVAPPVKGCGRGRDATEMFVENRAGTAAADWLSCGSVHDNVWPSLSPFYRGTTAFEHQLQHTLNRQQKDPQKVFTQSPEMCLNIFSHYSFKYHSRAKL